MSRVKYSPLGGALGVRTLGTRVELGGLDTAGSRVLAVFHVVFHCEMLMLILLEYEQMLVTKRTRREMQS
jgi:hypothetical protein